MLARKTSSLGEIAADAAVQFDPESLEEICSAMQDVLEKDDLRKKLIKSGFERLKMFDWKDHASKIIKLYEDSNNILPRRSRFRFIVRTSDSLIALVALVVFTLPLFIYTFCRKIFTGRKMFFSKLRYGKDERMLKIRYFDVTNVILSKATLFYYVFILDFRLVGVSIRTCFEEERQKGDSDLFMDCPGIFSLWFLRMSRGIAYSGYLKTELDYVTQRSFAGDLLIVLRSVLAILFFNKDKEFPPKINLMDVEFDNVSMKEAINALEKDMGAGKRKESVLC